MATGDESDESDRQRLTAELDQERAKAAAAEARAAGLVAAIGELGESLRVRDRDLTAVRRENEAERERLAEELATVQQQFTDTRAYLEQVEAELRKTRTDLDAMRTGGAAIRERMREAERRASIETRRNLERAEADLQELRADLETRRRAAAEFEVTLRHAERKAADTITARERELDTVRKQLETERDRAAVVKKSYEAEIGTLRQRETALAAQRTELLAHSEAAAQQLSRRDAEAREIDARLAQVEPRLKAAEAQCAKLQTVVQELQQETTQRRQAEETAVAELTRTNEALRQAQARTAVLEMEIANTNRARTMLEAAQRAADQRAVDLRTRLDATESVRQEAVQRQSMAEHTVEALEKDLEAARAKIAALESGSRRMEARLTERNTSSRDLEQRTSSMTARFDAEAGRLQTEVHELRARARALEEQHEALRRTADNDAKEAAAERARLTTLLAQREEEITGFHSRNAPARSREIETRLRGEISELTARCHTLQEQADDARRAADVEAKHATAAREQLRQMLTERDANQTVRRAPSGPKTELSDALVNQVHGLETQLAERESRCALLESQLTAAGRILDHLRAEREDLRTRLDAAATAAPTRRSTASARSRGSAS